jgi:hypothetical protein
MTAVVYAGPTIAATAVAEHLSAEVRPPVSQGDVYRAARDGARFIGIIDGYFDRVPAVWHKEILWAVSRGVRVYGSASMGALRAAELAEYGMVGVGAVFEGFYSGALEDDDEVAVTHGPADSGYQPLSEAMVNVRATIARAREAGVLGQASADALVTIAKALFYPERTYPALVSSGLERRLPMQEMAAFRAWVRSGAVNQKRADAIAMLQRMANDLVAPQARASAAFPFEPNDAWDVAVREMDATPGLAAAPAPKPDDAANALQSLLNEEIQLFGPYALVRAREKQRRFGAREAKSPADEETAVAWYFQQRLGRTVPGNLEAYARDIGMSGSSAFRKAVAIEYAYVHGLDVDDIERRSGPQ